MSIVVDFLVVVVHAPDGALAVGDDEPAVVADDDLRADGGDHLLALRQVPLVHVVEQRGEVLAVHLAGDRQPEERQAVGATSCVDAYQAMWSPAVLPARVPDQVRDLVGQAVRGGRRPAHVAVLAERQAVVAEHEHGRVVGDRVEHPAELVVHGLHVRHVRLADAVDVLVGEVERDHAAVGRPEAVVLHPAGPHVEGRRGVRVDRVERVHPDEEGARVLHLAERLRALAERALRGLGEPRERLEQLLVEPAREACRRATRPRRCRRAPGRPRSAVPGTAGCRSRRSS